MEKNKVVWSEGMFLSPQHFQQQERYLENYIKEYTGQILANCFGLTQLELDYSMLSIGKFSIKKAKGIFPDGTPFELEDSLVLDIDQNTHLKKIYIALPLNRSSSMSVGEDNHLRYNLIERAIYDSTQNYGDPIDIELAKMNISLMLEGEGLDNYTLLTVAYINEKKSDGTVVLNNAFVPQCLHFGVSNYLKYIISDLFSQVQYRTKLMANRLQIETTTKSYQALMKDYLWLQVLCTWLPKLEQWKESPFFLTRDLYLECLSMTGQMQGLEGKIPSSFPAWNPNDLYGIFSEVFAELLILLRDVQVDNVISLEWDTSLFKSRRLLRTCLQDRNLYNQSRFILVASSPIGVTRLSDEFPRAIKLSGNSDIAKLVRNAVSGVPLRYLPFAPAELKSRIDSAYFEIDTKSELWQSMVKKEEPIALHIDECIGQVDVEFYVIR